MTDERDHAPTGLLPAGLSLLLADGRQAAQHEAGLLALRAEVYGGPEVYGGRAADPGEGEPARLLRVWRRQPGFVLAAARSGGYLVAFGCGMPLRPSTSWWREVTTPLPERVTAEHPGRTFAITELAVRAAWRRQGIGTALHHALLTGRPEERATITVAPGASAAHSALRAWGWAKVARARDPGDPSAVLDVLIREPL